MEGEETKTRHVCVAAAAAADPLSRVAGVMTTGSSSFMASHDGETEGGGRQGREV